MSQFSLFDEEARRQAKASEPLASRMRPNSLEEFAGQDHILAPGKLLRRAIEADKLSSVIFYGPPGTGKTTLAQIIAQTTKAQFLSINAVLAGVKDIRQAIVQAQDHRRDFGKNTILFVDEVHRFNKSQQDALLPHVENGALTLIGATTENPYFEVNKALVSRSRIFQLHPLGEDSIQKILLNSLSDKNRGLGKQKIEINSQSLVHFARVASGDARTALNALELAATTTRPDENGVIHIDIEVAEDSIQKRAVLYDKDGDAHYDTISAFIKSIRGSDPDAALYWMAKMVYAGEEPRFLFRRMLILASEDVGLADPQALQVVHGAAQAFEYVGMPEGQFHLAQACLYLALAPKSNSTMAYFDALNAISSQQKDDVPDHLKDASRDGEGFGHGKGYVYPHAYRDHWVAQQYLPESLQGKEFYQPSVQGWEGERRNDVIRKREEQMASLDLAQWHAAHGLKHQWLERALTAAGPVMGRVREELFKMAKPAAGWLVVDLSDMEGFLSWEACRICYQGAVWTLCNDEQKKQRLQFWAGKLDELQRPNLFQANNDGLPADVIKSWDGFCFDLIMHFRIDDALPPEALLREMKSLSTGRTKFIVATSEPAKSTQISGLFLNESNNQDEGLLQKLIDTELKYFQQKSSGQKRITNLFEKTGWKVLDQKIFTFSQIRRFSRKQLETWWEEGGNDSLRYHYRTTLSEREWNRLKARATEIMIKKNLEWKQAFSFCVAHPV